MDYDFDEKCRKIGGFTSYIGGVEACFVNNKAIDLIVGEKDACEKMQGNIKKLGSLEVCSFDKDFLLNKDIDSDRRFKKLQYAIEYKNHFGIGNFTRFSEDFKKFLGQSLG